MTIKMSLVDATDSLRRTITMHDVLDGVQRLNDNTQAAMNLADSIHSGKVKMDSEEV